IELFEKYSVLSEREVHSRQEIFAEQYVTTLNIEVDTTEAIARTMVYPAAIRYLNELSTAVKDAKELGINHKGAESMLVTVNNALNQLSEALTGLTEAQEGLGTGTILETGMEYKETLIPAMNKVRDAVDLLERFTADDYWPLPIYREMLFVK
ncbi:MAG: hypothetical protein WD625_04500, partial [Balneolales bacterium]